MSKIGRVIMGISVSATLVLAGTLTSTAVVAAEPAPISAAPAAVIMKKDAHAPLDGETLFRAVVFGQGAAAERFSDLTKPVEKTEEINSEINRVVAAIDTADPAYFDNFADLAQSGNVLKVEEAFRITGPVLNSALTTLGYGTEANKDIVSPQCIQVILFAVAVLVYAAAGILQVAAVAVSVWYEPSDSSSRLSAPLSKDKWIAAATKALK